MTPKIIPADQYIHAADQTLPFCNDGTGPHTSFGKQYHAGTRSPGGLGARMDEFSQGHPQPGGGIANESHGSGFSTGQNDAVRCAAQEGATMDRNNKQWDDGTKN